MIPPPINAGCAEFTLLTGDAFAPWIASQCALTVESLFVSVYMISPYWRTPTNTGINLVETLAEVARRGVKCRLIVDQPNVAFKTKPFNVKAGEDLMRAGWRVAVMPDKRTLHEKIWLFDKRLALIGSHNISLASCTSNYDTSVAIRHKELADQVHRLFWERWRLASELKGDA
jgi:phosphatidylserine/phosphatidylglycerophosphate/cardiolipin synthase-like enzyme